MVPSRSPPTSHSLDVSSTSRDAASGNPLIDPRDRNSFFLPDTDQIWTRPRESRAANPSPVAIHHEGSDRALQPFCPGEEPPGRFRTGKRPHAQSPARVAEHQTCPVRCEHSRGGPSSPFAAVEVAHHPQLRPADTGRDQGVVGRAIHDGGSIGSEERPCLARCIGKDHRQSPGRRAMPPAVPGAKGHRGAVGRNRRDGTGVDAAKCVPRASGARHQGASPTPIRPGGWSRARSGDPRAAPSRRSRRWSLRRFVCPDRGPTGRRRHRRAPPT